MTKNKNLYTLAGALLVAGALLAGCTKEQRLEPTQDAGQMRFAVSVDGATKAGMSKDELIKLGEFYMNVVSEDSNFSYLETIRWIANNDPEPVIPGAWLPVSPMYWKNESASITYSAVASGYIEDLEEPYCSNLLDAIFSTGGGLMAIEMDQSWNIAYSDLLSLKATTLAFSNTTNGVVPVTLSHVLSKVNFEFILDEEFFNHSIVPEIEGPIDNVIIGRVHTIFNFKALSGEVTADTTYPPLFVEPHEYHLVPGTATEKNSKVYFEAILVPETLAAGHLTLNFNILGVDYVWTNSEAIVLAQGGEYTIPVNVEYKNQTAPAI